MSEPVKSNKEILASSNDTAVPVDTSAVDKVSSSLPTPVKDAADISGTNDIVDVSNLPTEGFDIGKFESAMTGTPSVEVAKPESKVEPKIEPVLEPKPAADKVQTQEPPRTGARDYTDFTPEEVGALKHMSNAAFNYVAPIIKQSKNLGRVIAQKDTEIAQLKTGKQILPDSYFEHPQAFILTKEFNDGARQLNNATAIQNHWRQQFSNIRKGEPWYDLNTDQQGNLVVGKEKQISNAEAEAQVQENLYAAVNQTAQFQNYVNKIQNNFTQRHTAAIAKIKSYEGEYFKAYEEPNHPMAPMIKEITNALPSEFRNNPLASLFAKSATAAVHFGKLLSAAQARIAELEKGGIKSGTKVNEPSDAQKLAGPTKDNLSTNGGGGKQGSTIGTDINDFVKAFES